jgi:hypothetical protein
LDPKTYKRLTHSYQKQNLAQGTNEWCAKAKQKVIIPLNNLFLPQIMIYFTDLQASLRILKFEQKI